MSEVKVGDDLAFNENYGATWVIDRVKKITPKGQIVTERGRRLNPDLTLRSRPFGSSRAQPVTDEILLKIWRKSVIDKLHKIHWDALRI